MIQIARQRAQRRGGLGVQRGLLRQPQILQHQIHAEAAAVATAGRHVFHHAGERVIQLAAPVAARAFVDNFAQHLGIQPQRSAEIQRLGSADHVDRQQHVVADFCHLPGALVAGVENVLAHFLQQRPRPLQRLSFAANNKRQRPRRRPGRATRHRRINHRAPRRLRRLIHRLRRLRRNGAAIDNQRAGLHHLQHSATAEIQILDMRAGGQHRHDNPGTRRRFRRRGRHLGTRRLRCLQCARRQIEHRQPKARFQQIQDHRPTHIAEADKGDVVVHISLLHLMFLYPLLCKSILARLAGRPAGQCQSGPQADGLGRMSNELPSLFSFDISKKKRGLTLTWPTIQKL